jgi:Rrf2 family protein
MAKLFNMSEAASIAIHAMVLIAKSKTSVNVIHISEITQTSRHHVAKVLQRLAKDGYVSSQRGPTGGFVLGKAANEISFLEIFESIEGKTQITHCLFSSPVCPLDKCIMNNVTRKLSEEFINYLKSQTLDMYL